MFAGVTHELCLHKKKESLSSPSVIRKWKIRKFIPPAMKQFNLQLSDIGKHINDIYDNLRFSSFIKNVQYVIDK